MIKLYKKRRMADRRAGTCKRRDGTGAKISFEQTGSKEKYNCLFHFEKSQYF